MRQINSNYDHGIGNAVVRAIRALRAAGHEVECPVTGDIVVDGVVIDGQRFERLAIDYADEPEELEIAIDNIIDEAGA